MTKKYKAIGSQVHITLYINGVSVPINFSPVSNYRAGQGGSEFITDNKIIQEALEASGYFGTTYFLETPEGDLVTKIEEEIDMNKAAEPEKQLEVIKVDSLASAKSWLMDNKGWSPKSRVTKKLLAEVAADYGVAFEGIE